ncbi:MAG: 3,4-dihydroxy-2-butanone-4-phosphate synthase [Alphaproteobacteria bacterium]|jgi:3,4-dihydroxy 2-butanone 4-phosphate synthase/GTP cyclohydrolase II|nr:3,4-dihydroxy-2-butanone-4-phosphate synthase [Alphaproteobacteria bacterium]
MRNVKAALEALKAGHPIIIVDNDDRENEGDLVAAAQTVSDETINFMVMHSSGVICLSLLDTHVDKLKLPMMNSANHAKDKFATAFTYSIEASSGVSTGISARDRAHTIRTAGNPSAVYTDVISPGHVFPLRARPGLLSERQGHTEASIEICLLAGLYPSAAIVEVAAPNGNMLRGEDLETFAKTYRVPIISVADIINYKENADTYVEKYSQAHLPTQFGDFDISVWHDVYSEELVVISRGDLTQENVPLRVHSKCLTGDVFHSLKCDCNEQLHNALKYINEKGYGMVVYLDQEGRGIGLSDKIKAYSLQEQGLDTIEANLKIGKPIDARTWDYALAVLKTYNLKSIELLTNNPDKISAMQTLYGNNVSTKSIPSSINEYNEKYIDTKLQKMKHATIRG